MTHGGTRKGAGRKLIGDTKMELVALQMPQKMIARIVRKATMTGKNKSVIIRELINKGLDI